MATNVARPITSGSDVRAPHIHHANGVWWVNYCGSREESRHHACLALWWLRTHGYPNAHMRPWEG